MQLSNLTNQVECRIQFSNLTNQVECTCFPDLIFEFLSDHGHSGLFSLILYKNTQNKQIIPRTTINHGAFSFPSFALAAIVLVLSFKLPLLTVARFCNQCALLSFLFCNYERRIAGNVCCEDGMKA
jgi:hypothetical protein